MNIPHLPPSGGQPRDVAITVNAILRALQGTPSSFVSSVALSLPAEFVISGSPVISAGTLDGAWTTQAANKIFAGPTSGGSATPGFRSLIAADIPALAYAPQTSGSSILYGDGSGGFSNVTVGAGLSFVAGTLANTVSAPLSLGFVLNSGAPGTNVGPELVSLRAGSLTKCFVVTKTSDGTTALTFNIKKNGTTIFTSNPSIAGGTSGGTVSDVSSSLASNPTTVAASDVFTIDLTSGNANWAATIELG